MRRNVFFLSVVFFCLLAEFSHGAIISASYQVLSSSTIITIANQVNQEYAEFQPKISGYVRDVNGNGVMDVNVTADNGGGSDTTDLNGYYEIEVPYEWSGTMIAQKLGYRIVPSEYTYSNVITNLVNQNFLIVYTEITVKKDGTGDFNSIQPAIDAAFIGDTVIVYPGRYYENINISGKDIILCSTEVNDPCVVASTIIDGKQRDSVLTFTGTETANCLLNGFTITGGKSYFNGGGIEGRSTKATIRNCTISNNSSVHAGGGLDHCYGTVQNCNISYNSTTDHGGGLYDCEGTIINCTISKNSAEYSGGGLIYCNGNIENCTISYNWSRQKNPVPYYVSHGGGLLACHGIIKNCMILGNWAEDDGGGLNNCDGTIINCTISGNYAWSNGDGLADCNGMIVNSIIWGNSNEQMYNCSVPSYSCIQNWVGGGTGNIIEDPCFVDKTNGNYYLSAYSVCIDAGDPNYSFHHNQTDIDGGPRVAGGRIDIGADEFSDSAPMLYLPISKFQFVALQGDPNPEAQSLIIRNYGLADSNWSISSNCSWLKVNPLSGTIPFNGEVIVSLNVDITGMSAGIDKCEVIVSDPAAKDNPTIRVQLKVIGPVLSIGPSSLCFEAEKGGAGPNNQIISIQNTGYGTLNWQIDIPLECGWLSLNPMSGQSAGEMDEVVLGVDATGLDIGFYSCELTVRDDNAENSPQIALVNLHVYTKGQRHVPAEYSTIQAAIDAAVDGDEVIIHPGVYSGKGNYNMFIVEKAITVRSIEPNNPAIVNSTVIDPNYSGGGFFLGEVDANSILEGLTIKRARTYEPASAISCSRCSPVIRNCVIKECLNPAISLYGSGATVSNCIITGNGSNEIGEYPVYRGYATVNCFVYPSSDGNASGPLITDCIISNNDSSGIYYSGYILNLTATVSNCLITGNRGSFMPNHPIGMTFGGGIIFAGGNLSVNNCTISGNTAVIGGGICSLGRYAGTAGNNIDVDNCIIWGNDANLGSQIAMTSYGDCISTALMVSHTDVQGGSQAVYIDPCAPCVLNWGEGNIDVDPCFAKPGNPGPISGLTSYWMFDEGQGDFVYNWVDFRRGNVHGAQWTTGQIGNALIFDGENDLVMGGPHNAVFPNNVLTWSVWINPSSYASNGVIFWDDSPQTGDDRGIKLRSDGKIGAGQLFIDTISSSIVSLGEWHHVAFTSGDGAMKLYIDGELHATSPGILPDYMEQSVIIIGSCFGEYPGVFHGVIDEVAIYDRALSSEEVKEIYLKGLNKCRLFFSLPGDYHLKSEAGRWNPKVYRECDLVGDGSINLLDFGIFAGCWQGEGLNLPGDFDSNGIVNISDLRIFAADYLKAYTPGAWVSDDVTSQCIDAGDPSSDWTAELWPHGKRINMGAYGGTPQASMSKSNIGNLSDLNLDNIIDYDDLLILAYRWLDESALLPENLDRKGSVNFTDFAILGNNWQRIIPDVTTNKYVYESNEGIVVNFFNTAGNKYDWIGLYRAGAVSNWDNLIDWLYSDGTFAGTASIINGSVTFEGFLAPGIYEVRLFFDDSYNIESTAYFEVE